MIACTSSSRLTASSYERCTWRKPRTLTARKTASPIATVRSKWGTPRGGPNRPPSPVRLPVIARSQAPNGRSRRDRCGLLAGMASTKTTTDADNPGSSRCDRRARRALAWCPPGRTRAPVTKCLPGPVEAPCAPSWMSHLAPILLDAAPTRGGRGGPRPCAPGGSPEQLLVVDVDQPSGTTALGPTGLLMVIIDQSAARKARPSSSMPTTKTVSGCVEARRLPWRKTPEPVGAGVTVALRCEPTTGTVDWPPWRAGSGR